MQEQRSLEERTRALEAFQRKLRYRFRDMSLLREALTHRSYVNENPAAAQRDNERLEFLGDAVLELCISDLLMKHFPDHQEGALSQLRSAMVNEQPLAELAASCRLGSCLLLGRGEEASGGRTKPSLLANAFEAVIAAIYLDGGFAEALTAVGRLFERRLEDGLRPYRDYKTALQQISQHLFKETPLYTVVRESGPDHGKTFEIRLTLSGHIRTTGTGKSKKEAEQRAAAQAIRMLEALHPSVPQ